jgi:hypothetical protein
MSSNTRPIGAGTLNRTVNLFAEEDALYGRAAFEADVSRGTLIRDLLYEGAKKLNPALAAEIEKVRKAHGIAVRITKAVTVALIAAMSLCGTHHARRGRRSLREVTSRPVFARKIEAC